jgi:hypothetical protein
MMTVRLAQLRRLERFWGKERGYTTQPMPAAFAAQHPAGGRCRVMLWWIVTDTSAHVWGLLHALPCHKLTHVSLTLMIRRHDYANIISAHTLSKLLYSSLWTGHMYSVAGCAHALCPVAAHTVATQLACAVAAAAPPLRQMPALLRTGAHTRALALLLPCRQCYRRTDSFTPASAANSVL